MVMLMSIGDIGDHDGDDIWSTGIQLLDIWKFDHRLKNSLKSKVAFVGYGGDMLMF